MRIAIVGYGTAGQTAAIFLARGGHEIDVFERSPELQPVGAGFLLQPTGLGVLDALGLRQHAIACGQRIDRLYGSNVADRMVMDMRYSDLDAARYGLGMTRGALFDLLHQCCRPLARIHCGSQVIAVDGDGHVHIEGSGSEPRRFDLIVVADGAHSRLRAASGLVRHDPPYPWGAMWCLLPAEGWPYRHELRQRYAGTRRMLGVLPVGRQPGQTEGNGWLTFYYSLPGRMVDQFGPEHIERMRADVRELWPELMPQISHLNDPACMRRARYRDVRLRRPWVGRCVFIGDAAHGMSPQLGQGVNMALLDAQALAVAMAAHPDLDTALPAFARERRRHVAIYQFLSRWLTPLFQSDHTWLGPLRDLCFGPAGRLPFARNQMLRILAGEKRRLLS